MTQPKPEVMRQNLISCHICVPADWTDKQVLTWIADENPSGTDNGWITLDENEHPDGNPKRNPCNDRKGYVHMVLVC